MYVRPESSDQFYIVSYCIKWVTTSWIYCILYGCFDIDVFRYYVQSLKSVLCMIYAYLTYGNVGLNSLFLRQ